MIKPTPRKLTLRKNVALKTFLIVTAICGDRLFMMPPAMADDDQNQPKHEKRAKTEKADKSNKPDKPAKIAKSTQRAKEKRSDSAKTSIPQFDEQLGLDGATLKLINEGKWQEAASALESQTTNAKTAGKKEAWLAFAYLYLNNCAKLKSLNDLAGAAPSSNVDGASSGPASTAPGAASGTNPSAPVTTGSGGASTPAASATSATSATSRSSSADSTASTTATTTTATAASTSTTAGTDQSAPTATATTTTATTASTAATVNSNRYALVISSFNRVCEGKRDEANILLQQMPTEAANDPICVFAQAAVASKRGLPAEAANFCQRVVALAPDFAWGYRTLGFLQQFSLKHPADAEVSYQKALNIEPDLDAVRKTLIQLKVNRNDYDDAIDLAKGLIAVHPDDASAHYLLADEIYIKQWRLREASAELENAIKYDGSNAKYFRAQAGVHRLQGDLPGALSAQTMAVQLGSDKAFELVELANLEQLLGNNNKAAEYLAQAIKLDPNNTSAHEKLILLLENEHRYDDLITEYTGLLKDKPKDAHLHLRLAKALASAGKIEDAEKEYVEAANLDPTDPEAHRQMGALKIRLRQFGAAAKEYTRALNINPSSVPDLVSLGYCYAENDDYMQAEAAYVTALALQQLLVQSGEVGPDRLDIMRSLSVLLMHETRYNDASNQLESIIAMRKPGADPSLDQFMLLRAKAMRDLTAQSATNLLTAFNNLDKQKQADQSLWLVDTLLKMKRPELAKDIIQQHVNDAPDTDAQCSWLVAVGRYDYATSNIDTAREVLQKVVDSKNSSPSLKSQALKAIADGYLAAGALPDAEKTVRVAVDTYPKNFSAYVLAGRIAEKNNDSKLAIDFAKKALEQNPYDANAYIVTGMAEARSGDNKGAMANFRKATELYPGMAEGHKLLSEALTKLSMTAEARKEEGIATSLEAQER